MDFKAIYRAMNQLEDNRKISKEIVVEALKEAMAKAYRKHIDIPDVQVRVDINEKSGEMKLYQLYTVVEEVEDDELEISLECFRKRCNKVGYMVWNWMELPDVLQNSFIRKRI